MVFFDKINNYMITEAFKQLFWMNSH